MERSNDESSAGHGHWDIMCDATRDSMIQPGERLDAKPVLAVICNSIPPYRLHVQRRIANEIPEVKLWTVCTHEQDSRWPLTAPADLKLVSFGVGESCWDQHKSRYAIHEWRKGGRVVEWLKGRRVSAVVLLGYNDLGRLRTLLWCRRNGVPCFIWGDSNICDDRVSGTKALLKSLLLPVVLRQAAGVFPCGRRGVEFFAKYGAPRDRMFLFPVEPDYELILGTTADQIENARRRYGLSPDRRRLVYSGRLSQEKRVDLLIDAFAQVAADRPQWDLLILGEGGLRAKLEARIPADIRKHVLWPGHISDPAMLAAVYHASDVLVLPSDREPWGLVINDAAAAGLAIVSTDIPGASAELVRDGVNGRIFPAGDLAALVECLMNVTHPQTIEVMKAASAGILREWRETGDPIQGLRHALESSGVIQR